MGIPKEAIRSIKMSRQFRYALAIWPFVLGILIIFGLYNGEHYFFPVIKDFQITHLERSDNKIVMSGYMRKVRECEYLNVIAHIDKNGKTIRLPITFLSRELTQISRPIGRQLWGPWQLTIPILPNNSNDRIEIDAYHHCHFAWVTETNMLEIPSNISNIIP